MKYFIALLLTYSSLAATADTHSVNDSLAENMVYVAALHTALKKDVDGIPQLFLNQLAVEETVDILKSNIGSERPDGSNDRSFPSGHTASAFAPAWYINNRYGTKEAIPYFIAATYVGYARIKLDKHHPEDVAASIALSYGMSKLFTGKEPPFSIYWDNGLGVRFFSEF